MPLIRPIGHIACALPILAVAISCRMRMATPAATYACWVDDDGCVYLAPARHPRAAAMLRSASEQRINTYRKPRDQPWPLTHADILDDLHAARIAHAQRQVQQAQPEALIA